jgi:predicted esterase
VFIAHGRRDPVISVEFARDARTRLEQAGAAVTYRESDAGHHVDPQTMRELPGFVEEALVRAQASS